jgi:hypothetical protein
VADSTRGRRFAHATRRRFHLHAGRDAVSKAHCCSRSRARIESGFFLTGEAALVGGGCAGGGRTLHQEVFLTISADEKFLSAYDFKAPLFIKGDCSRIFREDAEPDRTRGFRLNDGKCAMEKGTGESGAVVDGIDVEFAEFGRDGGGKAGMRAAAHDNHVGDNASAAFGEKNDDVRVVKQGEKSSGR